MNVVNCLLLIPNYTTIHHFTFGRPPFINNHVSAIAQLLHNALYVLETYTRFGLLMCFNLDKNRHSINSSIIVGLEYVLYHAEELLLLVSNK